MFKYFSSWIPASFGHNIYLTIIERILMAVKKGILAVDRPVMLAEWLSRP
jgi:hypothetical protein